MFGRRAFSVAGPMAWNTLPDDLRDPALPPHTFRVGLKTAVLILLAHQRIRGLTATMRYINSRLTLTLTLTRDVGLVLKSDSLVRPPDRLSRYCLYRPSRLRLHCVINFVSYSVSIKGYKTLHSTDNNTYNHGGWSLARSFDRKTIQVSCTFRNFVILKIRFSTNRLVKLTRAERYARNKLLFITESKGPPPNFVVKLYHAKRSNISRLSFSENRVTMSFPHNSHYRQTTDRQ